MRIVARHENELKCYRIKTAYEIFYRYGGVVLRHRPVSLAWRVTTYILNRASNLVLDLPRYDIISCNHYVIPSRNKHRTTRTISKSKFIFRLNGIYYYRNYRHCVILRARRSCTIMAIRPYESAYNNIKSTVRRVKFRIKFRIKYCSAKCIYREYRHRTSERRTQCVP